MLLVLFNEVYTSLAMRLFFSDEDGEDPGALLYLPISPDIDEPEEGWGQPPEPVRFCSLCRLNQGAEF